MKKIIAVVLVVAVVATIGASAVLAKPGIKPQGPAGESNEAHINLWQLEWVEVCDPECHWEYIGALKGGAWARIKYEIDGPTFDYVFNGHGLDPDTEYSLITPKTWMMYRLAEVIASGTRNQRWDHHHRICS